MTAIALSNRQGSKSTYGIGIGVNSTGFFYGKFLPWLVFWLVLGVVFGLGCASGGFCGWFGGGLCGWLGVHENIYGAAPAVQRHIQPIFFMLWWYCCFAIQKPLGEYGQPNNCFSFLHHLRINELSKWNSIWWLSKWDQFRACMLKLWEGWIYNYYNYERYHNNDKQ